MYHPKSLPWRIVLVLMLGSLLSGLITQWPCACFLRPSRAVRLYSGVESRELLGDPMLTVVVRSE